MSVQLTRVATTVLVSGLASLALAGPADALLVHDPEVGGILRADNNTGLRSTPPQQQPVTDGGGTPWTELGIGALGGLALAGAGTVAAVRMRHRHAATA